MTRKKARQDAAHLYRVEPAAPSHDTLRCEHCGTVLFNYDFGTDGMGRLLPPRCPNRAKHGTGWTAIPEPSPEEITRWRSCTYPGCESEFPLAEIGCTPKYCDAHREWMRKRWNNERKSPRAKKRREAQAEQWREHWQKKALT